MSLKPKEKALLNKIYRAVHDGVCPSCGNDMFLDDTVGLHQCPLCRFTVSSGDMMRMRSVIQEWGQEAVLFFKKWRKRRG